MKSTYACNVVIDLEFTPVPKSLRGNTDLTQEIIEVGAVKIAPDGSVVGTFSHMVRPVLAHGVSGKVRNITGIVNNDIACARSLPEVLESMAAWIGPGRARMVTWSEWDKKQITTECAAKGIECALPARWMDIQRLYSYFMDLGHKRVGLGDAADWLGIDNSKELAQRALYDAQMTAEIFRMMAAGDLAEHRARVRREIGHGSRVETCSASIASRCAGLAELMAALAREEGNAA